MLEKDFFAFEEQIWIDCVLEDFAYALEIVFLGLEIVFGGRASEIFFAEKVIFVDEQGFFFAGLVIYVLEEIFVFLETEIVFLVEICVELLDFLDEDFVDPDLVDLESFPRMRKMSLSQKRTKKKKMRKTTSDRVHENVSDLDPFC